MKINKVMKLIDKAAVVAEIKKHQAVWEGMDGDYCKGQRLAYSDVLSFLNTLEVKEVDLELNSFDATVCRIGSTYLKEIDKDAISKALESYKTGDRVKVIITT